MTHERFVSRLRMHAISECLCSVEYESDDHFWDGTIADRGSYHWRDGQVLSLAFSWGPTAVRGAAFHTKSAPLSNGAVPARFLLDMGPPVTHALWLDDGAWFVADEGQGIHALSTPLDPEQPFDPFFMHAREAATAWGWFTETPRDLHAAAFGIATLPPGSVVDPKLSRLFLGDTERHRRAERLLETLGLKAELFRE